MQRVLEGLRNLPDKPTLRTELPEPRWPRRDPDA
jgi:hypothetical protein